MAEKLSIQIALDGGAEIERQLAGIGEAGQKAFADISKSAEQVGFKNIKPEQVTAKLQEMGVTGVDSINKIQAAVKSAGRLEGLVQGIETAQGALRAMAMAAVPVGAAIVGAMTAAAKATIAFAGEINKINEQAIKLGAPVEKVDQFRAALEKAGVSAASVGQILQSKLASEQGVRGLETFIRQLEQMPDSAARSKAAVQEFGQAGAELIRILQAGGKLTGFGVGGLINAEDARRATELDQAINRLESSLARLNTTGFAPQLTVGINIAGAAVESLGQRLQAMPWGTLGQLMLSPFQLLASLITQTIANLAGLGPAIQQVGIATQQSSTMFTEWGTVAQQGATTAAAAVQQTATMFTSFGTVASQSADKAKASMEQAAGGTTTFGAAMQAAIDKAAAFATQIAGIVWDNISSVGVSAWNALTGAIQSAVSALGEFLSQLASAAMDKLRNLIGGGGAPAAAPGKASGGLLGGRGTGTSDSNLAWLSRGEYIMPAQAVRQPGVLTFLEALRRSGGIGRFAQGGLIPAFADGGWLDNAFRAFNPNLLEAVLGIAIAIKAQAETLINLMNLNSSGVGFAGGGLLGGRGTGTSDSNLAWVSRGEHIMPARAVRQPGVLAFLEMLRHSGGDLHRVLDGMGRFAMGGMVPRAIPAFASGGLGSSNVTIQFPGLPDISGLRASSGVVDQLRKAAALAQVRSGGRKPSRYS